MHEPANKNYQLQQQWNSFITTGDLRSVEGIYLHYFNLLYTYGKNLHAGDQLIEDAIQNVFLNLIRLRKHLNKVRCPNAYILSSFRNELWHLKRKTRRINCIEPIPEFLIFSGTSQEDTIIQYETASEFKKVLSMSLRKITSSQQEILFMRYSAGMSYEEISAILKISIESCRTSVYRALKTMRKYIEQEKLKGLKLFLFMWFQRSF